MNKTELKLSGTEDFFTQEAYKVLRSNLQFCGQDVRVIAITSCYENEGKTTISLNLGKSFAELDKKVLVVDADLRKSVMVGRNSNSKNVKGLSELLTGLAKFDECVYETQYPSLQLVFAGKNPPNPVELLSSVYFTEFLESVREKYDYVIIDLPPLGMVIDAAVVAPVCDGVALVLSDNNVRSSQAQEVIDQLEKSKSKVLGVIRNNTNRKKGKYYSYGDKRYSRRYKGYYKTEDNDKKKPE